MAFQSGRNTRFTIGCRFTSLLLVSSIALAADLRAAIAPANSPAAATAITVNTSGESQVVDAVGRPIAGVAVMIQPKPETLLPENITETTASVTDAEGRFKTPPPEAGGTYIVLRKPGLEALAMEANRPIPARITLRAARTIAGQVLTPDGQAISNAVIGPVDYPPLTRCLDHWEHRNPMPRQVTAAGADGSFRLTGVTIEPVGVQVQAPGFSPRQVILQPGETNVKVSLNTGGAIITGKVLGSKDRAPQPQIPIEARGNNLVLYSHTDNQGTYAFDNMPTGTWHLRPAGGGPLSGTQSRTEVFEVTQPAEVKDVPLVLNQGIMLAGRAIDATTSQPLSNINITLAGYAGRGAKAVLTDADGGFAFENLDSLQDVHLRFDPVKYVLVLPGGAYRDYFDINQAGDTNFDLTTITLALHKRLEVRGQVADVNGKPQPDVEIKLQSLDVVTSTPSKSGPGPLEFFSYSNASGGFHTGIYPPGRYKVWAQQDELVSQVETIDAYTTAPPPRLNLRLTQAAKAGGMVTDARDNPVTAAVVIAWPASAPEPTEEPIPGRDSYIFTKTDNKGHFELSGLRGEPMKLRATHPAYVQPVSQPLDPFSLQSGTTDSIRLKFPGGGEFAITVRDDQGQPLSQAEVYCDYKDGLIGNSITVRTDQFGRAFVGSLPVSQLDKIRVNHPVFAEHESSKPIPLPQLNYTVNLSKRGSVVATVTGKSPSPAPGIDVFLLHAPAADGGGAGASAAEPESGYQQTAQATVVAGKAVFPNLPTGWYKVAFADSGAYAESEAVYVSAGSGDHAVSLSLPTGNHLTGAVLDKATGQGLPGANVTLRPAVDSQIVHDRALQNTTTGEGGAFELYNVGAGRLHVKVLAAGYPDYESTITFKPGEPLTVYMNNQPGALTGRVTAGDAPVEGALLVLAKGGPNPSPIATSVSDASGNYRLTGFPAGSYSLSIEAPIGEGDNISRKTVAVTVEDETSVRDVAFQNLVVIKGRVILGGKPAQRSGGDPVTLLFRAANNESGSQMVQLNPDATYTVQLEPGDYTVSLEDREGRPVTIPSAASESLNLDF